MNILARLFLISLFLHLYLPGAAAADEYEQEGVLEGGNYVSKYDTMKSLKAQVTHLLKENEELERRHQKLKQEFDPLSNLEGPPAGGPQKPDTGVQRKDRFKLYAQIGDINGMNSELLLQRSRISYLEGRLLDIKDVYNVWQLRLSDLLLQQKKLETEQKEQTFVETAGQMDRDELINKLKWQLERSLKEEKLLEQHMREAVERSGTPDLSLLKSGTELLEGRIKEIETKRDMKLKENTFFRTKKQLIEKDWEQGAQDKIRQKEALAKKINALQEEYDSVNESMAKYFQMHQERKTAYQDVITLDRENQVLREQIFKLQEQEKNQK